MNSLLLLPYSYVEAKVCSMACTGQPIMTSFLAHIAHIQCTYNAYEEHSDHGLTALLLIYTVLTSHKNLAKMQLLVPYPLFTTCLFSCVPLYGICNYSQPCNGSILQLISLTLECEPKFSPALDLRLYGYDYQ